jgi:hypothetical protein
LVAPRGSEEDIAGVDVGLYAIKAERLINRPQIVHLDLAMAANIHAAQ